MATDDDLSTISKILKSSRTAIVTTRGKGGALHSRPLSNLEPDFTGTLWFFTQDPSPKIDEIHKHSEVNVAVLDGKGSLSFSGTASVDHDPATIDKYWNPYAEAWFEQGRDDPTIALLRVDVDTVEIWDTDKPAIVKAVEILKGIVTKTPPDVGESSTVTI